MNKPRVILGPPGTGKTTELMRIARDAIKQGVDPTRIGFISFTRQAAEQAVQRAGDFSRRGLPYFRTIHSLAYRQIGYRPNQVFGRKHLAEFASLHGYEYTTSNLVGEDGAFVGRTDDDKAFHVISLARVRNKSLSEQYEATQNVIPLDLEFSYIEQMAVHYDTFKGTNGLIDFTDMIVSYATADPEMYPKLDLLLVDEAQDLGYVQWLIADRLAMKADQVVYAGDDDQAIYEWSGADVERFIQLAESEKTDTQVLKYTFRFGTDVFLEGRKIITRCKHRVSKSWRPNDNESTVSREVGLDFIEQTDGEILILARNGYQLEEVISYLGETHTAASWGLVSNKKSKARIRVGTIHSAKGAEAETVVLLTDVSRTTYENIDSDAELRVWYVAVTRARRHLRIVEPQSQYYFEI